MTQHAFKDSADGYYEVDVQDGDNAPSWTCGMTSCPLMVPLQSAAQIEAAFTGAIQQRLDDFARTRNYDSILSACTYATSSVPKFQDEGQACVNLRDATWAAAYDVLSKVQAGQRPMPTGIADIEADLPALVWP